MADLDRERRRLRALELLGASYRVFERGGQGHGEAADALTGQAVEECGADIVIAVYAAWTRGTIPLPDGELWDAYVDARRAAMEVTGVRAAVRAVRERQARRAGKEGQAGG